MKRIREEVTSVAKRKFVDTKIWINYVLTNAETGLKVLYELMGVDS